MRVILKGTQAVIKTADKREALKSLLDLQEVAAKCPPQKMRGKLQEKENQR